MPMTLRTLLSNLFLTFSILVLFTGGNITATTYTTDGLADDSPLGTYTLEGDLLKVTYSDDTSFDYKILADGSLQIENGAILEFRGNEEPKHMGTSKK